MVSISNIKSKDNTSKERPDKFIQTSREEEFFKSVLISLAMKKEQSAILYKGSYTIKAPLSFNNALNTSTLSGLIFEVFIFSLTSRNAPINPIVLSKIYSLRSLKINFIQKHIRYSGVLFSTMTITNKAIVFWNKIKTLGTGEDPTTNAIITLMNQIATIGGVICFTLAVIANTFGLNLIYSLLALCFSVYLFLILIFNSVDKFFLSKFMVAAVLPILVSLYVVLIGGSFGEESILTVTLFLIYILYKEEPQQRDLLYLNLIVFYIAAAVFLFFFPPVFNFTNNPYDNLVTFFVCLGWLIMVIWLYQNEINIQQERQDILIEELKVKNANLQKTTEELEQFTYIASHDLKSPLRTIISFLDLIKRDVNRKKYDDLHSKIDFAKGGAEQMNLLVTDILEYSKITNGKERIKKLVSLQSIVENVKVNLTDLIQKRNVELYVFPLPDFYCNETEMLVLFQNFIENGIKYNQETKPTIFIKSKVKENQLVLQFIDNGIGIEEEYFEKIFLFFKRLHTTEIYQGTGLGLGLCKRIIDSMGGDVSVESMLNVGSTFTIILPILTPEEQVVVKGVFAVQNN
ncbi:MAG: signal transduction histidine kinase [Saprospiraceae bacterium]